MEPRDRAAQEVRPDALRSRVRLGAACVLLVGLAMAQSPGLLVADTKLDLATGPAGFLARATHLWDPVAAAGQLQNQAYGYLFPMGQFFLLGSLADVPGWAVQRLWLALVMCVAFLGVVRLARALGLRSDLALVLCGFAYALSPRMLTTLGPNSVEAWPGALAPWVLVPLVVGSEKGSARRAAALSAVAVALVGGVNAAAAFAVIPLGALWLLTRSPGPRRRSLMVWWPAFTAVGHPLVAGAAARARRLQSAIPGLDRVRVEHDVLDHALRHAARHLQLGAVRRSGLARGQRPDPAVLPADRQRRCAAARAGRPSPSPQPAPRLPLVGRAARDAHGQCRPSRICAGVGCGGCAGPARRDARAAAKRAQVRPRAPAAAGAGVRVGGRRRRAPALRTQGRRAATSTSWPDGYGFGRCSVPRRWRCWGRRCPPSPGT